LKKEMREEAELRGDAVEDEEEDTTLVEDLEDLDLENSRLSK
jgi:hypothetical protein